MQGQARNPPHAEIEVRYDRWQKFASWLDRDATVEMQLRLWTQHPNGSHAFSVPDGHVRFGHSNKVLKRPTAMPYPQINQFYPITQFPKARQVSIYLQLAQSTQVQMANTSHMTLPQAVSLPNRTSKIM